MAIGAPSVGTYTTFTAGTNNNVPFPPVVNAGDFVVLGYNIQAVGIPSLPTSTHSLWTSVAAFGGTGSTLQPALRFALYGPAVGDEAGTNANVVHATGAGSSGQMLGFGGVDQVTPQDVAVVLFTAGSVDSSAGGQAHCVITALTIVTAGVTLVSWVSSNTAAQTVTPATITAGTFTETGDGPGSGATGEMAYLQGVGTGSTGTADFLFSGTGKQIGVMLALRPASGGSVINGVCSMTAAATVTNVVTQLAPATLTAAAVLTALVRSRATVAAVAASTVTTVVTQGSSTALAAASSLSTVVTQGASMAAAAAASLSSSVVQGVTAGLTAVSTLGATVTQGVAATLSAVSSLVAAASGGIVVTRGNVAEGIRAAAAAVFGSRIVAAVLPGTRSTAGAAEGTRATATVVHAPRTEPSVKESP